MRLLPIGQNATPLTLNNRMTLNNWMPSNVVSLLSVLICVGNLSLQMSCRESQGFKELPATRSHLRNITHLLTRRKLPLTKAPRAIGMRRFLLQGRVGHCTSPHSHLVNVWGWLYKELRLDYIAHHAVRHSSCRNEELQYKSTECPSKQTNSISYYFLCGWEDNKGKQWISLDQTYILFQPCNQLKRNRCMLTNQCAVPLLCVLCIFYAVNEVAVIDGFVQHSQQPRLPDICWMIASCPSQWCIEIAYCEPMWAPSWKN